MTETGAKALTVSELTAYVRDLLDRDELLQDVWVMGEISNFTHHSSGHMYFSLKDAGSRIRAVMFASRNRKLIFRPEEGMKVVARGRVAVFDRDGTYQLYVEEMQPEGVGSLYLAFLQTRDRLQKEGLFDRERKRPLPAFPRVVGVITSTEGAAIRDIATTLRRRYPLARVVIFPALVQGPGAPASLAEALATACAYGELDVIIIGRGGGSPEELWAFNDESLARAIAAAPVPVVSAVGHETDFTIADYVADVRAPTPTAAAELVAPHVLELRRRVEEARRALVDALVRRVQGDRQRLEHLLGRPGLRRPEQWIQWRRQTVDGLHTRLGQAAWKSVFRRKEALIRLTDILGRHSPKEQIQRSQNRLETQKQKLQFAVWTGWQRAVHRFERQVDKLEALSPLAVMRRGWSLVYRPDRRELVRNISQLAPGDNVHVRLTGGWADCQVWGIEEESEDGGGATTAKEGSAPKRGRGGTRGTGQF
ncbi:MAG: exodeoxyribonuclease VII large subunit [Kyrpidia tusciae]|nr:exodeoxyribonuclease VII large subunit [Kyrpidia tusciae]MBE3551630.1 exodeoxyribonuclease VII large subunit [Kyrpidia tusciae]